MKLIFVIFFTSITSMFVDVDNKELAQTYINSYKDVAVQEMQRTGIPASIKLAQGLLESDWGRSDLANSANNHFGIKCGSKWNGGTFYKEDDDRNSKGKLIKSCFRSFASPIESYMAHSEFLTDPRKEYRYGFLFKFDSKDYKSWAKGLKKSGYATDPSYPKKLISIIEKYKLHKFDNQIGTSKDLARIEKNASTRKSKRRNNRESSKKEVVDGSKKSLKRAVLKKSVESDAAKESSTKRMPAKYVSRLAYEIETLNKCRKVTSKGGETLEELAHAIGVSVDELISFNEIYARPDIVLKDADNIFLEKKKRSFKGIAEYHLVQEGETMESIAQQYGMRLKSLFAKNRMPKNSETFPGVKLHLSRSASLSERPKFNLNDSKRKHNFLFEEEAE